MHHDNKSIIRRAQALGAIASALVITGIFFAWPKKIGEPSPPAANTTRFSVAVLAGPKQSTQTAPANVTETAESVTAATTPTNTPAVEAERSSSLPKAVAAAPDATPSVEVAQPQEVIPPARVAMPGGRLATEDAPIGTSPDPFGIGPKQVYLRLLVDETGRVVRGGIVRSGQDPMRDALIYKAMASRSYTTKNLMRVDGGQPLWQVDLVIDYGTNEFLP